MWHRIVDWFGDFTDRVRFVREFNINAKRAFENGTVPFFLKAKVTLGNRRNRHSNSKFFGGFRIFASTGGSLQLEQCKVIGMIIISNQKLVRRMITNGFHTLEVFSNNSGDGFHTAITNLLEG